MRGAPEEPGIFAGSFGAKAEQTEVEEPYKLSQKYPSRVLFQATCVNEPREGAAGVWSRLVRLRSGSERVASTAGSRVATRVLRIEVLRIKIVERPFMSKNV